MKFADLSRKLFSITVLIVYFFTMLFGYFPYYNLLDSTYAEQVSTKDNLVLVLVDSKVYNYDKSDISWYADYIQKQNKNTKAVVFSINTKLVKANNILKVIDNLYFNGEKTKASFLKTIVLIGDIPLPVVNKNGFIYPSIYPYVDVVKPEFKFDGKYFKYTGKPSNVEIAHGIIKFNKLSDYKKYFEKLKKYISNPKDFVDKEFYYDNFVTLGSSLNSGLIKFYLNKLIFGENILYNKITPLLLDFFDKQNKQELSDVSKSIKSSDKMDITPVTGTVASLLGFNSKQVRDFSNYQQIYQEKSDAFMKKFDNIVKTVESQRNPYWKIPALELSSSLKSFFKNYSQLFGNTYASTIYDNIKATGRYTGGNMISSLNIIDLKDTIGMGLLKSINSELESGLDEQISKNQYFMYYPIMVSDTIGDNSHADCETKYETFFYGKNIFDINKLSDLDIYRGTYGNYTGLDSLDKLPSRGEKSSVSVMNGLFDSQVEANRAYDPSGTASKDGNAFKAICSKSYGVCNNLGRAYNSESVLHWSKRIYGGYSTLNVDTKSMGSDVSYKLPLKYTNFKYAWHPLETPNKNGTLFDMAGSVYTNKKFETDNVFDVINSYKSVWKTKRYTQSYSMGSDGNEVVSCDVTHYADGSNKVAGTYYDYLKNFNQICSTAVCNNANTSGIFGIQKKECSVSLKANILTVTKYRPYTYAVGTGGDEACGFEKDKQLVFKFIDTRIKHTSPTDNDLSSLGISTRAKPIDSKNYVSFLGVGGSTVKLDYPDIFSVYVYQKSGDKLILKTPDEIDATIKDYLRSLIEKYNEKLKEQLDNKSKFYNDYKSAWNKISNSKYKPHSYSLLDKDYFINLLGEKKIAQVAETLYYLNLGWKEKPVSSTLSGEINSLYHSFDIYQKLSYVVGNYIDTEDKYNVDGYDLSHSDLNFPAKPKKGYEAGVLISKNLDDTNLDNVESDGQLMATQLLNQGLANNTNPIESEKNECGRPLGAGVIIWEWPSAFMCRLQVTMQKPFKIGSSNVCSSTESGLLDMLKDKFEKTKKDNIIDTKKDINLAEHPIVGLNLYVGSSDYENEAISGSIVVNQDNNLSIGTPVDFKTISFYSPNSTGNCFYIKNGDSYYNTCEGVTLPFDQNKWKYDFYFYNPSNGEGKYFSYKAGNKEIDVKLCTYDNKCYYKKLYFQKDPGKLVYAKITPFSPVMVYGGENPVAIVGYDALPEQHRYANVINSTYYDYKLILSPTIGLIKTSLDTKGSSSIDFNFADNQKLLFIKSNTEPLNGVNKFKIVGKLDPSWSILSGKVLNGFSKTINIVKKTNLSSSEVKLNASMSDIKLPDNPNYFYSGNTFDKNKIYKINIRPIVADHVLKTPVYVSDTDKHFIVGTYQNGKFVKQNSFLITSDAGVDVYLVPTYKTGPFSIKISVPGINPYFVKGKIEPFPVKALYVKLDKYQANPNELIKGSIFGVDKFGNLETNLSGLKIITSSGIRAVLNGNTIKILGTKSGFVTFKLNKIENTVKIGINDTFIPLDKKISIMYLTLFGYDWGKYASSIMSKSDKNLAITTTMVDPQNLHKFDYLINSSLSLNTDGVGLSYSGDNIILDYGKFTVNTNQNPFSNVKYIKAISLVTNNGVYYVPQALDSLVKSNVLNDSIISINNNVIVNFKNGYLDPNVLLVFNKSLSDKYSLAVYDVVYNKKLVGNLVVKNAFDINKFNINKPFYTQIVYGDGTTNGPKAFGISISDAKYKWISNNTRFDVQDDKGLGFTSNFKNITNFAAGEDVGDATKPFANEFLVNYGDPFLKRISKETTIPQVGVSKTYGYNVYSDISGGIKKVIPIDFNNDGKKDLIIVYNSGKLRFLKNYSGKDNFEDLGNLMVLGKPIKDAFAGDYNGDGYEDLYVIFDDGTIRVYKNNHGEFAVNGTPVCLDLPKTDGYHLKYSQIFFRDMNNDKKTDIIVNDLAGNIKIFYGGTYLSKILTGCDANFKARLKEQLVKSYGIQVSSGTKFADDGYIYREGMKDDSTLLRSDVRKAFENKTLTTSLPTNANITPSNYLQSVQGSGQNKFAFQPIPSVLGPSYEKISGDTIDFKKITFLTGSDSVEVYKTMKDLNGGDLLPGDKVEVTLHVNDKDNKKLTYLELLKGPFAVISSGNQVLLKLDNVSGDKITFPKSPYDQFLFRIDNVDHSFSVSYFAIYEGGSPVQIKVGDYDNNKYGDIKVFIKNGCIKGYDYFQGENGSIPMKFSYSFKNLANELTKKIDSLDTTKDLSTTVDNIKNAFNHVQSGSTDDLSKLFNKYFGNNEEKNNNPWNDSMNINVNMDIGPDIGSIKAKVDKVMQGLCHGFSIGDSSCGGTPVPCNFAFLAPGVINACGCPLGTDPGFPVFWYPGTVFTPVPIAIPWGLMSSMDNINMGGVYPSQIRIYLAPTLTKSLGVALCFGNYKLAMNVPPGAAGTIAGNCVIATKPLTSGKCSKTDNQNADNTETNDLLDLDNGICDALPFVHGIYTISPLKIPGANNFYGASINPAYSNASFGGLLTFSRTAHKFNSMKDAKELLEGGKVFHLKTETGTFKGLISCIIKKWLNKQIEFLISQLTHMTIYVVYPNVGDLLAKSGNTWEKITGKKSSDYNGETTKSTENKNNNSLWDRIVDSYTTGNSEIRANSSYGNIEKWIITRFPSKQVLKDASKQLSNPFKQLETFFKSIPLVNVSTKTVVIKVPWIGKDEIERQIIYLNTWLERNKKILNQWTDFYTSAVGTCKEKYKKDPEAERNCEQKYANILKVRKFVDSIQKNIEILNSYRNLPLQLYKYVHLTDFYLQQLSCIINKYLDMIIGWISRNEKIFEKWVDAIITIINLIKTWQVLIDISVNWKTTCGKCRADNGDLYDCTLSGLCPDLPVLPIPPFKLPDIFIDLSHINLGIDVVLPQVKIVPIPIGLFTLPDLPYPNISIEIPAVPLLPAPPKFPPLPSLPAFPTLELPNLPPPPLIPKLMPSIKGALNIFKIVAYFRCVIKNGIGLVAEWNVKTRIEQLTERTNRLFPFDFLTVDYPVLPFAGYDIKVDAYLNYKLNFDTVYQFVQNIANSINSKTSKATGKMLKFNINWNKEINKLKNSGWSNGGLNAELKPGAFLFPKKFIEKGGIKTKLAKGILYDQLNYLLSQENANYLKSLPHSIFARAANIKNDLLKKNTVYPNYDGIAKVRKEVDKYIYKQRNLLNKEKDIIKNIGNPKYLKSYNLVSSVSDTGGKVKFYTNLFNTSDRVKKLLSSQPDIRYSYLKMWGKVLDKFAKKLPKYESRHDNKYYIYKQMEEPIKKSLRIINPIIKTNYSFAAPESSSNPIIADPTQFIRGLYMKGSDGIYYNVLADKKKAKKIRENNDYVLSDINNDGKKDMIWWDNYNVYIKYSGDEPEDEGIVYKQLYIYPKVVSSFANIVGKDGYVKIADSYFKIQDVKNPVNDLDSAGSSYEDLSLKFTADHSVNSYVLLYSSRIDILDDLEKKFNYASDFNWAGTDYKTYGIVLYDKKLGNVNEVLANQILVNGHKAKYFVYVPIDLQNINSIIAVLKKDILAFGGKWKYFRVLKSDLNLENKQLSILSSYSNQEVGGEQLVSDNISPNLIVSLHRNEIKTVGTGQNLNAYIDTHYKLIGNWKDNVSMKYEFITDATYHLIKTGSSLDLFEKEPVVKHYHFIGIDWNGNKTDKLVTVTFNIPKIQIDSVNSNNGDITANISADMDKTAVKFYVKDGDTYKVLKSVSGKTVFTGGAGKIVFTGSIFNLNKSVTLYNSSGDVIGSVGLNNGIIKVNKPYYVLGVSDGSILMNKVYSPDGKELFKIYVPSEKLLGKPIMLNTSQFDLKVITGANSLGEFSNSYCIFDKNANQCAIYISKDRGAIYIDKDYSFVAKYSYNELGNVTYEFYNTIVPLESLLVKKNAIFDVNLKPSSISK